ncbi:MAG: hypothetical protein GX594_00690 [Pirellulaceae bacterium]|nr:hypothetical protein [Pirellulaceae bacterium]
MNEPSWLEYPDWPGYNQYIRIWTADGAKEVPRDRASALPITLNAQAVDLLIEGLAEYYSQPYLRLIAHFEPDGEYVEAGIEAEVADAVMAKVIDLFIDMDIDSDNNNGYGSPDHSDQEEYLEANPYGLGKLIIPNWLDFDQDGVLNCWDGYFVGSAYLGQDTSHASEMFYQITVTLPAGLDYTRAKIEFIYEMIGALPVPADRSVPPTPDGNGAIRIWTKDGLERRNGSYLNDDPVLCGDFIPTNMAYKASTFGFSESTHTVTFYVEGVVQADNMHTYADVLANDRPTEPITVKCYPNGDIGGLTLTDEVNYIVTDTESFYYNLYAHEELRASLASEGIYGPEDLPKYCMELLNFEQLAKTHETHGFGFTGPTTASLFSIGGGVYHDYISGKNILTFKGTDTDTWTECFEDWLDNIKQAVNPPASQYTTAMRIAMDLREIWDHPFRPQPAVYTSTTPSDWLIAGHSLGGGLAAAASVVSGFHADTFNAAGVNYVTVQQFCQNHPNIGLTITSQAQLQSRAAGLVTSYVVNGEVLNYAQDGLLAPELGLAWPLAGDLPVSIGTRVPLDSGYIILPTPLSLPGRVCLHSYYVESLLLSYNIPVPPLPWWVIL